MPRARQSNTRVPCSRRRAVVPAAHAEELTCTAITFARAARQWSRRRRSEAPAAAPSEPRAHPPTPAAHAGEHSRELVSRRATHGQVPQRRGLSLCSACMFAVPGGTRIQSWSASYVRIIMPATPDGAGAGLAHAGRHRGMRVRAARTRPHIRDGQRAARRDLQLGRGRLPLLIGP